MNMSETAKLPPYSLEAEQSVLGGLMLRNEAWYDLADKLADEDFYREDHRTIFRAIAALMGNAKPCDYLTVVEQLKHEGKLEEAGGMAYLGELANNTPSAANVLAYAEIVRERSVLRSLIAAGNDIAELGFRPDGRSQEELVDHAEQKVFGIREQGAKAHSQFQPIHSLMDMVEATVDRLSKGGTLSGLETGIIDLDRMTNGLRPGELIIVAGRPGMGKTSFAMNIAEHAAIALKEPVAVFSMEMSGEQLALRVLSSFGRIDQTKLRSGQMDDHDWAKMTSASSLIREAPLFIDETGALSPMDLRARARRLARQHGVKLILVDYIQLMQIPGSRDGRTAEISAISRNLKALAKELNVPIIALSQLSREVEKRENKRPIMSDLRESGSIEQDADLILFIYRGAYYKRKEGLEASPDEDNTAEVIIAKQRSGPTGTVKTAFLGKYTRFDNLSHSDYGY